MLRRRLSAAIAWRLRAVTGRVDAVGDHVQEVHARLLSIEDRLAALGSKLDEQQVLLEQLHPLLENVEPVLRAVVDEEADNRRRLFALRDGGEYERAYDDPNPLVSVVVATVGRAEVLTQRALPSLLAQTYENIEFVVVGDAVGPEVAEAIDALGDPRVRHANLTQRTMAHSDPRRHRLVGSTMARNEAARLARGRWLVHFDDDDHLRPGAIASLLEVARESRAEVAYGGFEQHEPDGRRIRGLAFPPRAGAFAWPAALVHSGLRFFERELIAAQLELPGDMYMLERMLRAGVRFAMLEEIVLDYYPSSSWGGRVDAARRSGTAASR